MKQWNVVFPVQYPVDNDAVQTVLRAALGIRYIDIIADSGNPADYGLAPKPWVKFIAGNETFYLGDETPTHKGVYAKIDGDSRILLVNKNFRADLFKLPFDLRDKTILPNIDLMNLDTVKIVRTSGEIKLIRKGFQWWIISPIAAKASNKIVDNILDKIISAKASDFPAENYSDSTLKKLQVRKFAQITLSTNDSAKYTMNIYISKSMVNEKPKVIYASVNNKAPLFEISQQVFDILNTRISTFRERKLFDKLADADRFIIEEVNNFKFECKFKAGDWFILYPDSNKADKDKIAKMLAAFSSIYIDSFVPFGQDTDFEPSGWKFSFYIGSDSIAILIGDTIDNKLRIESQQFGTNEYYLIHDRNILDYCKSDRNRFFAQ